MSFCPYLVSLETLGPVLELKINVILFFQLIDLDWIDLDEQHNSIDCLLSGKMLFSYCVVKEKNNCLCQRKYTKHFLIPASYM